MNLFEKIKAKIKWLMTQPESVKAKYVWVSALVVIAVVVLLWIGLFRKYERKPADSGNNSELIDAAKKLENEIGDKIKIPDIKLPKISPSVSPEIFPSVSSAPEANLEVL